MQSPNIQDFPIYPYHEIFTGLKDWGF